MVCKYTNGNTRFLGPSWVLITMVFGSIVGSDYYGMVWYGMPPRNSVTAQQREWYYASRVSCNSVHCRHGGSVGENHRSNTIMLVFVLFSFLMPPFWWKRRIMVDIGTWEQSALVAPCGRLIILGYHEVRAGCQM